MIDDADLSEKKGEETRRRRPQDVPMLSPRFPPDVIEMIIERLNGLSEKWVAGHQSEKYND